MAIVASWARLQFDSLRQPRCGDALSRPSRNGSRKHYGTHITDHPKPFSSCQLASHIAGEVKDEETTLECNRARLLVRRKYAKSVVRRESRIATVGRVPSKHRGRRWHKLQCSLT
jgi:hypothetical protein